MWSWNQSSSWTANRKGAYSRWIFPWHFPVFEYFVVKGLPSRVLKWQVPLLLISLKKNGVLIVSLNYINHMYSECRHQSTNRKLLKKDFCLPFSTLECVSLKTYFHFTDHTGYSSKHLYTALRSIPSLPIPSNCSRKYAM